MELREQVETIQKDIAQLTEIMREKAQKDLSGEVRELSDKLTEVQKELRERKIQFESHKASASAKSDKELAVAMDELFIAKQLCINPETKSLNEGAWGKVKEAYADTIKAFGDVDASTTATADSFIPTGFSSQFQEEIFLALEVAALFGRMNMPASDYKLPFAPGRLIATAGAEGGTVAKVKPQDARVTFTAKKLMSIVELTDELEQDSIIPVLNLFRKQLIGGFALAQDTMALNGGGTGTEIYNPALASTDCRSLVKGIRFDGIANCKLDVATLTNKYCGTEAIRGLRAAMGKYGKSPSELALLVSIADYNKLLNEPNYQSLYSYGPNAVILAGELGRIDNIPIVVSELIPKAALATDAADAPGGLNASGVWDNTTKTKTTFCLVNKSGFMWGDRKEFSLELWRNPLNQTNNLIGSQRLDFEKVVGVTGATTCGVGYNY